MKRKIIIGILTPVVLAIILWTATVIYAALAMTETEIAGQAWVEVLPGILNPGTTISLTTGYSKCLLIESGVTEAGDFGGATFTVEISEDEHNWIELTSFSSTADATVNVDDVNDASSTAGDAFLILTDSATDEFDVVGRLWFVYDGTSSEVVRTVSNANPDTVTLASPTVHNHADTTPVYDRAYNWVVSIPPSAAHARVSCLNNDAETNCAYAARPILLTGI